MRTFPASAFLAFETTFPLVSGKHMTLPGETEVRVTGFESGAFSVELLGVAGSLPSYTVPFADLELGDDAPNVLRCPACNEVHVHEHEGSRHGEDSHGQEIDIDCWTCSGCRTAWCD